MCAAVVDEYEYGIPVHVLVLVLVKHISAWYCLYSTVPYSITSRTRTAVLYLVTEK